MTTLEVSVVVIGLLIGYWLVSMIGGSGKAHATQESADTKQIARIQPPAEQLDCHKVLGIPADATTDEVRTAYRLQMSMYHPDKVASLGKELQSVAERKSKEINVAHEEALKLRGEQV